MLHLRVTCPAEATDAVLDRLRDECGAVHLVVLRGAVVDPPGDLIEAEVAREAADEVLAALCELGVDRTGGITLEPLDTVLSDAANAAERAAPGDPADAVVWDELIERTGGDSRLTVTYLGLLTLACLIAVVGVVTDSAVTIVGAMVVGPEFAPLAAMAIGLVLRRGDLVRRASIALGVGFPLAMLVALAGALVGEWTGLIDVQELRSSGQPRQVDFIFDVGVASVVLALLAGAAGMLSLTSARSAALIGVFISVTTVPAAAFAVVAATIGEWWTVAASTGQLLVNLVGIVIAGIVVLLLHTRRDGPTLRRPLTPG